MKKFAVIVAGGSGSRMKSNLPKQFMLLSGKPVLMRTLEQFYLSDEDVQLILVLPVTQISIWKELCETHTFTIAHQVVSGGVSRFESVKNGLELVANNSIVAIHDGVRPLVSLTIINTSYKVASTEGSAIAAVTLKDSIREKNKLDTISKERSNYYLVQTPQTFQSKLIKEAYSALKNASPNFTDDASVFEAFGKVVTLIEGDYRNLKITMPEDMQIAQALFENS